MDPINEDIPSAALAPALLRWANGTYTANEIWEDVHESAQAKAYRARCGD